jgi:hypothetical protein
VKTIQNVEIWKIAVGVCLGLFAAQSIPAAINELHFAAIPCDRPNLSQMAEASCSISRLAANQKQFIEKMEEETKAKKEADAKFAKDHPEEWMAKQAKKEQEYQATLKAEQDRQSAIDEQIKKEDQYKKDTEAYQAAESKKRADEWAAEKEERRKNLEQIGINAQNQAHQDALDAANFGKSADNTAAAAALAEFKEESDRTWRETIAATQGNSKPADTEPSP